MVTIFLTDEAQDMLLEEFRENGFPELYDAEWTKDILIEPTEASISIRCQISGGEESYLKAERFFPPTINMRESETVTVNDRELNEIHDRVQEYLSGEVEIPGIPTDEENGWLRNSVLFRRMVIPYVQKHFDGGSLDERDERSGLYFFCEEDEIKAQPVSGEGRPELMYIRFNKNGEISEEPGRYYEDEIYSGEKLKDAIKELEHRPQFLNIEGIGEGLNWPPQMLEQYQCGRLLLDGRLRKNELGGKVVPVSFNRKDMLWQHPKKAFVERIYTTIDTLLVLPEVEIPIKCIPTELLPEAVVEIVDSAFTCIIEMDGLNLKNTRLSLYNRFGLPMLSPVFAEAAGVCEGVKAFLEDGHFASDGEGYLGDVAFSLLFGYKKLLAVLITSDWFGKHGRTDNEQAGIMIESAGDEVLIRRVEGNRRPDLICSAPEGERMSFRPYQKDEDCSGPEIVEKISVQTILDMNRDPAKLLRDKLGTGDMLKKEAAEGNPQAMKLLAEKLAPQDKRAALAWYEKAAALLPDDDDLEFEIFMLKMELENQ